MNLVYAVYGIDDIRKRQIKELELVLLEIDISDWDRESCKVLGKYVYSLIICHTYKYVIINRVEAL